MDSRPLAHHGKSEVRLEDDALVRGAGQFVDDPRLPNQAYAVFVRSPHAHAPHRVGDDRRRRARPRACWRCSPPRT